MLIIFLFILIENVTKYADERIFFYEQELSCHERKPMNDALIMFDFLLYKLVELFFFDLIAKTILDQISKLLKNSFICKNISMKKEKIKF